MSPRPETIARQKELEARTLEILAQHFPDAGMVDSFVAVTSGQHELCLDLHVSTHKPTEHRIRQRQALRDLGCRVIPCRSIVEVKMALASLRRRS